MNIQQIRNATVRITYDDNVFLIDPWLIKKGAMGCFSDTPFRCADPAKENIPMPMCDLPMPAEDVLRGVDAYIVTHVHPDHIDIEPDGTVGKTLNKNLPTYVQSTDDANIFLRSGFSNVTVMYENSSFGNVNLIKTLGRHGTKIPCGPSCGVIFISNNEKTLYVIGDTIWYDAIKNTLSKFQPDVIVVNACAAELLYEGRLIMNDTDILSIHDMCPHSRIIISHMDTVAHATISRSDMKKFIYENGLEQYTVMPDDGEVVTF